MPTQVIAARLTGASDLSAAVVAPRFLYLDLDGASDLNAWVNRSPLPGATISGTSEMTIGHLGLGHVLTAAGGITVGGAATVGIGHALGGTGGVTIGGSAAFLLGSAALGAISGGITIGGAARLATGAAFGMAGAA